MSDIRFNQWLHNSGTGGVSQVDGGHVGIGTTNPLIPVGSGNTAILNVGVVTASTYYGDGSNLSGIVGGGTSLSFNDNIGAYFGNSQDLKIYHDGNHSYIDDQGTGNLRLRSGTLEILNLAGNKTSATFSSGGGQTLNFNNSAKFVTTNTGAVVTGILTATRIVSTIGTFGGDTAISGSLQIADTIQHEGDVNTKIRFPAVDTFSVETAGSERLRITSTGRINIGDADQSQNVDQFSVTVAAQNAIDNVARFQSNAAASGTSETLVKIYKGSGYGGVVSGYITQGTDHGLKFYTADSGTLSERLRIDSQGNVKSGTVGSALNFTDSNSGNTKSIEVAASGGGDALLVTHSSGYGVGYFGYEAGGDRLVIACDGGGGNNKIDFITDAGTSTGGGTDNLNAKVPKMRISAAGHITKPYNPAFIAGRTGGNQTLTVGTFPLNVARLNVGNHYSTSTYKFTAPVAGVYYFYAQVYYNNGAGQYRMGFRKTPSGGSAFMLNTSSHQAPNNDSQNSMSIIESLAVGDTVALYSDQNHSIQCYYNINNNTFGAHTYFMGYLIG